MDILIREARPEDAAGINHVLNPIIEAGLYTVLDTTFTEDEEREYIINFPKRGIFHVALQSQDGRIVGLQTIEPFATYTHAFDHVAGIGTFIDLSVNRCGIGMRLSERTFEVARQRGFEKIFTYVRANNQASLGFHLKLGFNIVGTAQRQAKFGKKYVDEVIIEKFL